MGQDSKIQWTHHTFNPWSGCTKVSDGCKFCYAEKNYSVKMRGVKWGPQGNRIIKADSGWKEPLKWNRHAAGGVCVDCGEPMLRRADCIDCVCGQIGAIGETERPRVFCASLADVFEGPDTMPPSEWPKVEEARKRLFDLICRTPNLDWLLLTKRPENALETMVRAGLYAVANSSLPCPQPNIWIGTSVENQQTADARVPHLLNVPAVVHFLSCEPLLGAIDLANIRHADGEHVTDALNGETVYLPTTCIDSEAGVDWVIVGGESGPRARPCNVEWIRGLVSQCKAASVACFVKQLGAKPIVENLARLVDWKCPAAPLPEPLCGAVLHLADPKGGEMTEWPEDLRVHQMPTPSPKQGIPQA